MPKEFALITQFQGYRNKTDVTNMPPGVLVSPSKNVISTDGDRIASRKGYELYGATSVALTPIESSYEWQTHRGNTLPLRSFDDTLQVDIGGTWYDLLTGLAAVDFNFAEFWDTTEVQDLLLFVNGSSNIYDWSGGHTTFASATVNTIVKEGSTSWAEEGFLTSGTRKVIIEGIEYTYTGGESTTTLTGVTPDPTLGGHTAGDVAIQATRVQANSAITSTNVSVPADFANDLIEVINNQIYLGSLTSRAVYVSQVNSKSNFSKSSPRLPAEGEKITLDGTPTAFVVQEDVMYISAGQEQWYTVASTLSSDLTKESLTVKRLTTSTQQAARSQGAVAKIKNSIVFISNEPTLDTLGRVEQITTPQAKPLSDPIKNDFDNYDFTNCHLKYFKNNLYIALPVEGIVLIRNLEKGFWEAPQILPVRRFAVIGNELYGHSSATAETYKLFTGYNDNTLPIDAVATFSYQNFGERVKLKNFTEHYSEGYITENTDLTLTINYDYQGFTQITEKTIEGDDSAILFGTPDTDTSLGTESLGSEPLGGGGSDEEEVLPPKFRVISTMTKQDFYEVQFQYSSYGIDQQWELLAFGPATSLSTADAVSIKD
jgi:hypothetical protein